MAAQVRQRPKEGQGLGVAPVAARQVEEDGDDVIGRKQGLIGLRSELEPGQSRAGDRWKIESLRLFSDLEAGDLDLLQLQSDLGG